MSHTQDKIYKKHICFGMKLNVLHVMFTYSLMILLRRSMRRVLSKVKVKVKGDVLIPVQALKGPKVPEG